MNAQTESDTRLSGSWLSIARLAWVTVFIVLTVMYVLGFLAAQETLSTVCKEEFCTLRQQIRHTDAGEQVVSSSGPPIGSADRLRPDQVEALERFGLTLDQYGWLGALQMGLPVLVYLLIAAGLFWWKPDDWTVLFASIMVATIPHENGPLAFTLAVRQPAWEWVSSSVGVVGLSCFLIFPLIFPTGQFVPRWTRWMALFEIVGAVIIALIPNSVLESSRTDNFVVIYIVFSFCTGVYAQLYRYFRVASPVERQQLKWVIVGLAGFIGIGVVLLLPLDALLTSRAVDMDPARALLLSSIPDTVFQVILLFIPVSIAFSVLRYRLWDIDVIISRTLVYGSLTASVVGLYVLIVGGLSTLLQIRNELPNIIIAISLIAFLVQPLRRRLQQIVNRIVPVPKVPVRESIPSPVQPMEIPRTAVITESAPKSVVIPERSPRTSLHDRWLFLARLAWVAVFITLTLVYAFGFLAVHETLSTICEAEPCTLTEQIRHTDAGEQMVRSAGPPLGFADRLRPDQVEALKTLGVSLDQYGWLGALQLGLPALILLLIAAGLFWWKSDDWMALFASIMVATFPVHNTPLVFNLSTRQPAWEWVGDSVTVVALGCLLIFPLIFPTGLFVPRWTRWMAIYDIAAALIVSFVPILEVFGNVSGIAFIAALVLLPFAIGVFAQLYRYLRVALPAERQQFKWVVVGLVGTLVIQFVVLIPLNALLTSPRFSTDPVRALILSAIPDTLWQLNNLLIAACIVISVLRYRLWDIDIIISRTLVYGALTASVVGLYVLIVGGLSTLLQIRNELPSSIIAILLIALIVQPLRRRLQESVDRIVPAPRNIIRESISPPVPQMELQQSVVMPESAPSAILHGRWLVLARLAWAAIAVLAIIVYAAAVPVAFNQMRSGCGLKPCEMSSKIASEPANASPEQVEQARQFDAWSHTLVEAFLRFLTLSVALLIVWRRSDDWMAQIASIMLVAVHAVFSPSPLMLENVQQVWHWPIVLLRAIALTSAIGLFYLFPDGRFVPRWTRWPAIGLLVLIGALVAAGAPFQTGLPVFIIALTTGAGFQVYRYRSVSTPLQRQQTKWVVLGFIGMVLPMLVFFIFGFLNPSLNPLQSNAPLFSPEATTFSLLLVFCVIIPLCFLPVTLAFSLLRYRLWDVDIVINRALIYGALTAGVVGLYILTVGWLSIGLQTLPANLFAIMLIAFLFWPLRRLLQRIADRLVPVSRSALPLDRPVNHSSISEGQGADTTLHGRWLLIARLAWAAVFIALTAMYAFGFLAVRDALSTVCEDVSCSLIQQIRHIGAGETVETSPGPSVGAADRLRPDQVEALKTLGVTLDRYSWLGALQMGLPLLVYMLIAAGLFWRKSDDWMVLFASIMVATIPSGPVPLAFTLAVRQPAWEWVFNSTFMVSISCLFIFPLIFPTGRLVPRWTRWMVLLHIAFAVIISLFRNSLSENANALNGILIYLLAAFGIGIYAQLYRYFRLASSVERQQLKWVIVGLAGFIGIATGVLEPLNSLLTSRAAGMDPARAIFLSGILDTIFQAVLLFIPVSIAISVLRYRLWDIDILVSRTLVYGALTACIIALYILLVGTLSLISQTTGNLLISLLATGLIAFLFQPLRERLQRGVNRLVYGERDDPYVALSRLGRRLEVSLAPEAVLPTVVTTVREVLKLPYVAIYLQQDSHGFKIVAESASPLLQIENGRIRVPGMNREGLCFPLIHQGETLGYIVLGPRAPNEAFGSTDLRLLDDLAPQVGVAVHAVRLTADLQRSRERLVLAREEERRRLRRDLHDDLGPTLASLGLAASTVAELIPRNPTAATKMVKELEGQIRGTVGNIRKLVYDLRPPTLDELGLLAAVRERAARYSNAPNAFHVAVAAPAELPALPAAVEVAAYRIVQEALENVLKHSRALECVIRFANHHGLEIEITDDGIGLPSSITPGVGLRSMRERAEELGGSCVIERSVTGGTRILAHLPIGDFDGTFANLDRG